MSSKRWILQMQDVDLVNKLARTLKLSPVVAQILINRGITSVEAGRQFLQCDLAETPDPFLMLGMEKAVVRIQRALAQGEKIVIYGDYDADGQTATALLVRALRELTSFPEHITYYLPDRLAEGYGLHADALAMLAKETSLVITVDCGIAALDEIAYAQNLGLEIIVTDHHEPGPVLPAAVAILNPKQEDCAYPHKDLAGVGVACKLIQALGLPQERWQSYLDLVALGTVADLVPLQGENRTWVHHGLKQMALTSNLGLRALLEVAAVENPSAGHLGFRIGPRLNAVGRLGDPTRGVRLLLTQDQAEAKQLASELDLENSRRQDLENRVVEEAMAVVEKHKLHKRSALVVWGSGWHQGVVGIVASRLVERYYLPTVVISVQGGQGVASARSISGLDLYQTLTECGSLLTKYGGHTMAAGLSLPEENFLPFQKTFEQLCAAHLSPEDYIPKLFIDGTVQLHEITPELIEELGSLEPHGMGNPGPTLQAQVAVLRTRTVGQDNRHLQLTVQDATKIELSAIAFGIGDQKSLVEKHAESVSLAFVPGFNDWRNTRTIQLQLKAWEPKKGLDDYVQQWMVNDYPWRLGASYFQSSALHCAEAHIERGPSLHVVDLRGTWDKVGVLRERRNREERTLILVNTPATVLKVCRELRILVPGGTDFIGFEHEWLAPQEREQLEKSSPPWLVSTGYGLGSSLWPSVWLWEPPLTEVNLALWSSRVAAGGELVGVYGPKDIRAMQTYLTQSYPDRKGLARIYTLLRRPNGETKLDWAHEQLEALGMLGALPVAIGVFSELGLWKVAGNTITYLPAPAQKLDLQQTVLYNKVTKMRRQSSEHLKRGLERGFFQDGLKRQN